MWKSYIEKADELIKLAKTDFLFNDGVSNNNIPFFIFSYQPKEELKARKLAEDFCD